MKPDTQEGKQLPTRYRISRKLLQISRNDFEWAMDHSRRKYRVREAIDGDHPTIAAGAEFSSETLRKGRKRPSVITIIRLSDGKKWIGSGQTITFPYPWEDTDAYAEQRISAMAEAERKFERGEL
jgi:hypothetical protein